MPERSQHQMTPDEVATLKRFYAVETDRELIAAMDRHITKLQAKLRPFERPMPARTVVREG